VPQVIDTKIIVTNAGASNIYGSELEATFKPGSDITIALNFAYLHARYSNYTGPDGARPFYPLPVDFSGKSLDNAPDYSGHLSVEKRWAAFSGMISARIEGDYSSKVYFSPGNYDLLSQRGFFKANAFVSYADDHGWSVEGFVRNITDKVTKTAGNVDAAVAGSPAEGSVSPPRTFGVSLSYDF